MVDLTQKQMETLSKTSLFQGITENELLDLLSCLGAYTKTYRKDTYIFHSQDIVHEVGIVLEGTVHILQDNLFEQPHIITAILPSGIFAESFAASHTHRMGVSVQAATNTTILFLEVEKILHPCTKGCYYHNQLLDHFVEALANHNLALNEKLMHLTQTSMKDKILSYLSQEAHKQQSSYIELPFNRQQLADYLNVDRSALSKELSKLKKEGVLDYHKNQFKLKLPSSKNE